MKNSSFNVAQRTERRDSNCASRSQMWVFLLCSPGGPSPSVHGRKSKNKYSSKIQLPENCLKWSNKVFVPRYLCLISTLSVFLTGPCTHTRMKATTWRWRRPEVSLCRCDSLSRPVADIISVFLMKKVLMASVQIGSNLLLQTGGCKSRWAASAEALGVKTIMLFVSWLLPSHQRDSLSFLLMMRCRIITD